MEQEQPVQVLPAAEVQRRAEEIFAKKVRPALAEESPDSFVAIDVHGGGWVVRPDAAAAHLAVRRQSPHAQIWLRRVRPGPTYSFAGGGGTRFGGGADARAAGPDGAPIVGSGIGDP